MGIVTHEDFATESDDDLKSFLEPEGVLHIHRLHRKVDGLLALPLLLSWFLIDQYCQTEYAMDSTVFECCSMFQIPCTVSSARSLDILRSAVYLSQFAWPVARRHTVHPSVRFHHSVLIVMGPIVRISGNIQNSSWRGKFRKSRLQRKFLFLRIGGDIKLNTQ